MRKIALSVIVVLILIGPIIMVDGSLLSRIIEDKSSNDEYKRDSFYMKATGEINDISISVPIVNQDYDIIAFLAFRNITIPLNSLINEANLTVNMILNFINSTDPITITVYGYDSSLGTGTFENPSASPSVTSKNTVYDLKNVTSEQYVNIEVTDIIQEIINKNTWTVNDTIGLVIFGSKGSVSRSYQSNYAIKRPQLNIRYDVTPTGTPNEVYVGQYENFTIWQTSGGFILYSMREVDPPSTESRIMVWDPANELVTNRTMSINGVGEKFYHNMVVLDNKIYRLEYVQVDADLELWSSINSGVTWSLVREIDTVTAKDSGHLYYNNETNTLEVIWSESQVPYASRYNLTSLSWTDFGNIMTIAGANGGLEDIVSAEDGDIYVIRCGGTTTPVSTVFHTYFIQRVNGVWSSPTKIYDGSTYPFSYPQLHYSKKLNALILVLFRTSQGSWVTYHDLDDPMTTWLTPVRVTNTDTLSLHNSLFYGDRIYVGTERPDPGSPADIIPAVGEMDFPFDGPATRYGSSNFTGHDFSGTTPVKLEDDEMMYVTMRQTGGGSVYYVPGSWFGGDHTLVDWDFIDIAEEYETPNKFYVVGHDQMFISGIRWVVRYDNGSEVPPDKLPCLASAETYEDVIDCVDSLVDDPTDPSPEGWDPNEGGGWYSRSRIRLYFFMIGWVLVWTPPFVLMMVHGVEKISWFWIGFMMMMIGLAFLWAIKEI
jgi:hypothetical protein